MNMNNLSKHLLTLLASIIVVAGCIYGGRVEYNDAVLSAMSQEKYEYIRSRLGSRASNEDVVKEYVANQKYYNSINY